MSSSGQPNQSTDRGPGWLSASILVGVLPGLGLILAYAHEYGYLSVFEVPPSLISIQFSTVIQATATVLFLVGFLVTLFNLFYPGLRSRVVGPLGKRVYAALLPTILFVIATLFIYVKHPIEWILPSVVITANFALIFFNDVMQARIAHSELHTLHEQLVQRDKDEIESRTGDLYSDVRRSGYKSILGVGILVTVLLYLSYSTGRAEALDQTRFYVIDIGKPYAVLRIYGNEFILTDLDPTGHRLGGTYRILTVDADHPIDLQPRDIGPLVADCRAFVGCRRS